MKMSPEIKTFLKRLRDGYYSEALNIITDFSTTPNFNKLGALQIGEKQHDLYDITKEILLQLEARKLEYTYKIHFGTDLENQVYSSALYRLNIITPDLYNIIDILRAPHQQQKEKIEHEAARAEKNAQLIQNIKTFFYHFFCCLFAIPINVNTGSRQLSLPSAHKGLFCFDLPPRVISSETKSSPEAKVVSSDSEQAEIIRCASDTSLGR